MMLRVGLTGGIASGKSTIARILERLGCHVIDADRIVSELYEPGKAGYLAVVNRYTSGILDAKGQIDRAKLSTAALLTESGARELNLLIHPLVTEETGRLLAAIESSDPARDSIGVVEASLILEGGTRHQYDKIVVVDLDPVRQLERAVSRGMKREEAERRMARQHRRDARLAAADYVIENGGDLAAAEVQTFQVYRQLLGDLEILKREGRAWQGSDPVAR